MQKLRVVIDPAIRYFPYRTPCSHSDAIPRYPSVGQFCFSTSPHFRSSELLLFHGQECIWKPLKNFLRRKRL